ncbi:hypothetical protein ACQ4PT_042540 [Festuca glaucescens]
MSGSGGDSGGDSAGADVAFPGGRLWASSLESDEESGKDLLEDSLRLLREGLTFYEVPKSTDLRLKNNSGKVGRVRVSGGTMNIQQLVKELNWITPGENQWDVTLASEDSFIVVFPTKADLTRLCKFKPIEIESTPYTLHFSEWSAKQIDKWGVFYIWVSFTGYPDTLCRDYLGIFALGSLIGKTTEVDMKFTREHGIVRAHIDCANPVCIPGELDHFYDGDGFVIQVYLEGLDGSVFLAGDYDSDHRDDKDKEKKNDKNKEDKTKDDLVEDGDKDSEKEHKASDNKPVDHNSAPTDMATGSLEGLEDCEPIKVGTVVCHSWPGTPPPQHGVIIGQASAPSKRWYQMVDEDEAEEARSAPPNLMRFRRSRGCLYDGLTG